MSQIHKRSRSNSKAHVLRGKVGDNILRFNEVDSTGAATGRGASFTGVEFQGLQYSDLINHKLGTKIEIPLRWSNSRVVESSLKGITPEGVASCNTTLESRFSSRTIGLVKDGWLPSGLALQSDMVVMPDKCTVSEISSRFRDGIKKKETDLDFIDIFADRAVRINPLLYALEGNIKENPTPEIIEREFDHACATIKNALPMAILVPEGRSGLAGVIGLVNDSLAGMKRKQEFLLQMYPKLRAPISARRVGMLWDEALAKADECDVPRKSLVVLAVLSAICVSNGKSPAKRLLKFNEDSYSLSHSYNALSDLRALEVLMYIFALFPEQKVMICTGDKDLALFWSGIRASSFTMMNSSLTCKFSPVEAFLPNITDERKISYFSNE